MSQTGSNIDTYLTKTAAYGFRAHDDTGITLDSAANKVVLENSPTSSAPDKAVATVGWVLGTPKAQLASEVRAVLMGTVLSNLGGLC